MQYKFYRIGINEEKIEEEINAFLRSVRVLQVQKEFVSLGAQSFWSLCVEYLESSSLKARNAARSKVDYKEVLSSEDFVVFSRLRELRKELATEEAIPVYAICTNEQLADVVKKHPKNITELRKIEGFGESKVKKYGNQILLNLAVKTESVSAQKKHSPVKEEHS